MFSANVLLHTHTRKYIYCHRTTKVEETTLREKFQEYSVLFQPGRKEITEPLPVMTFDLVL